MAARYNVRSPTTHAASSAWPPDDSAAHLTYIGFDAVVLDRYDPHQTQFGPMYSNQSAVFSKLYRYASHEEPTWENIVPDLAESAPEMIGDPPDDYVVKLRKGVKFHDTEKIRQQLPGPGRPGADRGRRDIQLPAAEQPGQPPAHLLLPLQPVQDDRQDGEGRRLHHQVSRRRSPSRRSTTSWPTPTP